jgi:tellurite resistance protein TerC
MITIPGVSQEVMWVGFLLLVFVFLFLDLKVLNKKNHEPSMKEALGWTLMWVIVALIFNAYLFWQFGSEIGIQFLGGYLLEYSLSIDNLFVIFLIFQSFRVEKQYQHRILFWGIVGVLVMRGVFIMLGSALISKFHWLFYIFGIFLIYSGINLFSKKDDEFDPHDSWVVRTVRRLVPVTKNHKGGQFIVKEGGKVAVTVLFVALLVIEFTDLIFALDSIPAIFGITTDPFLVFTSNVFAILGLRSLYFLIAKMHDIFIFLKEGLAAVLVFIGIKMVFMDYVHMSVAASLLVIVGLLGISIAMSLWLGKKYDKHKKIDGKKVRK